MNWMDWTGLKFWVDWFQGEIVPTPLESQIMLLIICAMVAINIFQQALLVKRNRRLHELQNLLKEMPQVNIDSKNTNRSNSPRDKRQVSKVRKLLFQSKANYVTNDISNQENKETFNNMPPHTSRLTKEGSFVNHNREEPTTC